MKGEARIGDYLVLCDLSGFKCWASETVKRWDGMRVHRRFVGSEIARHPQDLIRSIRDDQTVPDVRSEPAPTYLNPGDVTPSSL